MTVIVVGISFALIWLVTTFFIVRYINKLKNDLLNKHSDNEKQPEKSEDIPKEKTYKPFEKIKNIEPAYLLNFIQQEHPQVIALILAHMEPDKASIILQNLPHKTQSDVARRIATMDRVSYEITREIERVVEMKLSSLANEDYSSAGGVENMVNILNFVDRASEKQIIEDLEDNDPELAEEIKKRMFIFEDIIFLDDNAIQKVIRKVDSKELAKALKVVDPAVQNKILKNMSKRAANTLKLDMEYMGPLRLKDMEESQQNIISIIRYFEETGDIRITRN
jgi:flagellar motor switch protein FliG